MSFAIKWVFDQNIVSSIINSNMVSITSREKSCLWKSRQCGAFIRNRSKPRGHLCQLLSVGSPNVHQHEGPNILQDLLQVNLNGQPGYLLSLKIRVQSKVVFKVCSLFVKLLRSISMTFFL